MRKPKPNQASGFASVLLGVFVAIQAVFAWHVGEAITQVHWAGVAQSFELVADAR